MSLKTFGKSKPNGVQSGGAPVAPAESEPKKDPRLTKSVRITRSQWRRIRQLETDTEKTFQALCIEGLSRLFEEHGLEPL